MNTVNERVLASIQQNDLEHTRRLAKQALIKAIDEQDDASLYELIVSFEQLGFIDLAIELTEEAFAVWPSDEWALMLAELHIDNSQFDEALDLLLTIASHSAEYPRALLLMAEIYQLQELYEVAEHKLTLAKNSAPHEPIIDLALAELSFLMGEHRRALELYDSVRHTNILDESDIVKKISRTLIVMGEFEETITLLEGISQENHDSDSLFELAFAYFQIEEYSRAISGFNLLLQKDPDYLSAQYYLGRAYIETHQIKEAIVVFEKAIDNNPYQAALYTELMTLYQTSNEVDKATRLFEKAREYVPDHTPLNILYALSLKQDEDYEGVIDFVTTQLQEYQDEDSRYYWLLATAHAKLEEDEPAQHFYEQAYVDYKDNVDFLEEYAYYLREIGQRDTLTKIVKHLTELDADWVME